VIGSFKDLLFQSFPDIYDFCDPRVFENPQLNSLRIELEPKTEPGREVISLGVYDNHITLSYDYYERYFHIGDKAFKDVSTEVIDILKKILTEQLVAVTTYNDINTSRVPGLMTPDEAIRIKRKKNFRARSWSGTFDDDYP
jgi:hypothetical protein